MSNKGPDMYWNQMRLEAYGFMTWPASGRYLRCFSANSVINRIYQIGKYLHFVYNKKYNKNAREASA